MTCWASEAGHGGPSHTKPTLSSPSSWAAFLPF